MEHSLFPRKRTLLGRARGHHAERNALRNRLANQAKEAKEGRKHGHHNHVEHGRTSRDTTGKRSTLLIFLQSFIKLFFYRREGNLSRIARIAII